jgi:hypothetical protein
LIVIASHRVGAARRPMTGSAKQSIGQRSKDGKDGSLRRGACHRARTLRDPLAPRNDEENPDLVYCLAPYCAILFQFATLCGRGLSSGTSPERIAPESLTPLHSGFVHRNISR